MFEKLNSMLVIPHDKAMHSLYGLFIYSVIATWSCLIGLLAVIIIGVGKEVYDYRNKDTHTPDLMDAVYTIAPALVIFTLDMMF